MSHAARNSDDAGVHVVGSRLSEAGAALSTQLIRSMGLTVVDGCHAGVFVGSTGSDDLRSGAGSALCSRSLVAAVWDLEDAAVNRICSEFHVGLFTVGTGSFRGLGQAVRDLGDTRVLIVSIGGDDLRRGAT